MNGKGTNNNSITTHIVEPNHDFFTSKTHISDNKNEALSLDNEEIIFDEDDQHDNDWDNTSIKSNESFIKIDVNLTKSMQPNCWICCTCNTINNLLVSAQMYHYKCCYCNHDFNKKMTTIYSNHWAQIKADWICFSCTFQNSGRVSTCKMCKKQVARYYIEDHYVKRNSVSHVKQSSTTTLPDIDEYGALFLATEMNSTELNAAVIAN
eukprot:123185_1